jgi:hypothetical protein
MKKRWLLWLGLAGGAGLIACAAALLFVPERPGPVRLRSAEIREGMSGAEVEAILGEGSAEIPAGPVQFVRVGRRSWQDPDFALVVYFHDGRVIGAYPVELRKHSPLDRLRARLGL